MQYPIFTTGNSDLGQFLPGANASQGSDKEQYLHSNVDFKNIPTLLITKTNSQPNASGNGGEVLP
jgi:hypothetical protein